MNNNNFEFWCSIDNFNKAIDAKTGEEIMLLGGIASTADEDSDGEFLDPRGFDIQPLLKSGLVNWHHQAKTNPGTIVGEPIKAEIRKEGLYIETQLYPHSQIAKDIWDLAKTLASDSKTRRLGYSIEGRVLQRKSEDPTDPDYKKIVKAVITGVAITHQPKNPKTFANIIKGEIDDDIDEEDKNEEINEKEKKVNVEESLDTETGSALKKESVDDDMKVVTFGKSEVFDKIFNDVPGISINKAKNIYNLIEKIVMKKNSNVITQEDIEKAYDALGIEMPTLDFSKAEDDDEDVDTEDTDTDDEGYDEEEGGEDTNDKDVEKADEFEELDTNGDGYISKKEWRAAGKELEEFNLIDTNKDGKISHEEWEAYYSDNADEDDEDTDEDYDEEEDDDVKKADLGNRFNRIEKAIAASHNSQSRYVKALGVIVKAQSLQLEKAQQSINDAIDTINRQSNIIKGYEDQFDEINEQLARYGSSTPAPKSVRNSAPIERVFRKGMDDDMNNNQLLANQVSIKNRAAVSEILDQATFAKGYDEEFSKACTAYEAGADLPNSVIARIKNEFNIEIVR